MDLFAAQRSAHERIGEQAWLLPGFALPQADALVAATAAVTNASPLRQMLTPGGKRMAVAMSNCGPLGWVSDRGGYRYSASDPLRDAPWPAMPPVIFALAQRAAAEAGFAAFAPDACLINRYQPGTRLSLHQDRDERDYSAPIVSISLGMSATFLFGGHQRSDPVTRIPLHHGDVVVWGGVDRLRFHGVMPLTGSPHPGLGPQRYNLTLRKAD